MALATDIAGFSRLITALDPWLERMVIVGVWAHRLYHLHPAAQKLDFAPLMTLDADVALPRTLPSQTPAIRDALVAYGFVESSAATTRRRRRSIIWEKAVAGSTQSSLRLSAAASTQDPESGRRLRRSLASIRSGYGSSNCS